MTKYIITAAIEQELNSALCIQSKKDILCQLSLQITFQLNHENIQWHEQPAPEIRILEIINLETKMMMDYEHLSIITKINIRKQCREFLTAMNFDPYRNIIPFSKVAYRFSDPFNQDPSHLAELIEFNFKI